MGCFLRALVAVSTVVLVVAGPNVGPSQAIVGGTLHDPTEFPYFVKVVSSTYQCGGSVIDPAWILTAAHCVASDKNDAGNVQVSLPQLTGSFPSWTATDIVPHPLWNGEGDTHDLALVHLAAGNAPPAIPFPGPGLTPIQVGAPWDPGVYAAGTEAAIMGTGEISPGHSMPTLGLLVADTPIRSDAYMRQLSARWDDALLIGAGSTNQSTCYGDSGGPLVVGRTTAQPVLVGVNNFGVRECAEAAAFAELAGPQLAWLASVVPSIMNRWGACTDDSSQPWYNAASYTLSYTPGAHRDGAYYWQIGCWTPTTMVPDLKGDDRSEAAAELQSVGLHLGTVRVAIDYTCTSIDLVTGQYPSAGSPVPPGSAVSITLGGPPPRCL